MSGEALYPVWIAGRGFLADTARSANGAFRRTSVQLLNTQQNIDKGESALTTPEVWRRTYQSWHHGEGQAFADREDSDPYRYLRGRGVDPWTKWELTPLPDTEKVDSVDGGVDGVLLENPNAPSVIAVLQSSRKGVNRVYVPPTPAQQGTQSLNFQYPSRICQIGTERAFVVTNNKTVVALSLADNGNLQAQDIGSLKAEQHDVSGTQKDIVPFPGTFDIDYVGFLNGILVMALSDGSVWDISAAFSVTPAALAPITARFITRVYGGIRFVDGCSGADSFYLAGNMGTQGVVHSFTIDRTSGVDVKYSGIVAELPTEETLYAAYSYLGYVALGTSAGFRFAAQASGALTYGPLIETPEPVQRFEGQGRFLYFTMSKAWDRDEPDPTAIPADPATLRRVKASGIGRADLSQFVTDLQPAYALDLTTPIANNIYDDVLWVHKVNGRMVFGTAHNGVWAETNKPVEHGVITLSGWTFNVTDNKIGLYTIVRLRPGSDGSGGLYAEYDQSNELHPLQTETPILTPTESVKFVMGGQKFGSVHFHGLITSNLTPTGGKRAEPVIVGMETRATYERGMASEWQVPCILSDEYERDNGAVEQRDVVDDFTHLIRLVQNSQVFTYREDERSWQVYATEFVWTPQERSERAGWQGVFTIAFREIR